MDKYKEIDQYIGVYKTGMAAEVGSDAREKGKWAAEILLMTFKPLILSIISKTKGISQGGFEDAYQDGSLAFIEGLNVFEPERGAGFGAFIKRHLQFYFWKRQHKLMAVQEEAVLDAPVAGTDGLCMIDLLTDEETDIEGQYIKKATQKKLHGQLLKGLKVLTPIQRSAIESCYYKGLKKAEIARNRGVTANTVQKTHSAALKKLKKFLETD